MANDEAHVAAAVETSGMAGSLANELKITIDPDAQEVITQRKFEHEVSVVFALLPKHFPGASEVFLVTSYEDYAGAEAHFVLEVKSPLDRVEFRDAVLAFLLEIRDRGLSIFLWLTVTRMYKRIVE